MVGGNTPGVAFLVADDHAITQRVQLVLLAEHSKELHGGIVSAGCRRLCLCEIGAGETGASGVLDTCGLTHFHTDMGVVCGAASMPTPVIPRQRLISNAGVRINEAMDAGRVVVRPIPVLEKHQCRRLWAADGMEHHPLGASALEQGIPAVLIVDVRPIAGVVSHKRRNEIHMVPGRKKPFIKCPTTNSCARCPHGRKPEDKLAPVISLDGLLEDGYEPAPAESVERQVLKKIEYEEIRARMDAEDPRIALAFEAKELCGETVQEIANELGVSAPRVYQLIARAKEIGRSYREETM